MQLLTGWNVSIRDILDVHKNEQQQLKSEMLKLMSENFESQLEDIVEQTQ